MVVAVTIDDYENETGGKAIDDGGVLRFDLVRTFILDIHTCVHTFNINYAVNRMKT